MYSQRRAVVAALRAWTEAGKPAVLATVIASTESAPRGIGAQLAVTSDDVWVGGLSGGCAEVVVLDAARPLLDGPTSAAVRVDVDRDTSAAGPVCGATLDVLIERVDRGVVDELDDIVVHGSAGRDVVISRIYHGGSAELTRHSWSIATASRAAAPMTVTETADTLSIAEFVAAPPRLVLCGAGDVAADLIVQAQRLGWRTLVVDPRAAFVAQLLRVAQPDVLVEAWPDAAWTGISVGERDACVTLAHDHKLDMPFLEKALSSPAFYVGAVGSRRVQSERRAHLKDLGESVLGTLHGPAGLNLGGTGAAEIAVSIMAEILATLHGRDPVALRDTQQLVRGR